MRVLKLLCDETYTLDGSEWFVVCTDKLLTKCHPYGKIHKRIYICLDGHGKAEEFADRMRKPKYKLSHIRVTKDFPYFRPSRYTMAIEIADNSLWNY